MQKALDTNFTPYKELIMLFFQMTIKFNATN